MVTYDAGQGFIFLSYVQGTKAQRGEVPFPDLSEAEPQTHVSWPKSTSPLEASLSRIGWDLETW